MDLTELRIGNWLMFNGHTPSRVEKIDSYQRTINDLPADDDDMFTPMDVTPEILEKAGFERIMEIASNTNWTYRMVTRTQTKLFYHCGTSSFFIGEPVASRTSIIYVHQLQNIFFSLTRQELTIIL